VHLDQLIFPQTQDGIISWDMINEIEIPALDRFRLSFSSLMIINI
jgi:hypothetical protein